MSKASLYLCSPTLKTCSSAISACGRQSQWQEALKILFSLSGHRLRQDVVAYGAAISACEKGYQWQAAVWLMSKMSEIAVLPNLITLNATISACGRCSEWAYGLHLLRIPDAAKMVPNTVTYNASISACVKGSQPEVAFDLLTEMDCAHLQPDVITYNSMIGTCEGEGHWERALRVLNLLQKSTLKPNVVTFTAVMNACGQAAKWQQVLQLLVEMRTSQVQPNLVTRNVVRSACENGEAQIRHLKMMALDVFPQQHCLVPLRSEPASLCFPVEVDVHFCIFQGCLGGLESWSLKDSSKQNRWDAVLDSLLQCVMQDGAWPTRVRASAFMSADALHVSGDIQNLIMPVVGKRSTGQPMYQPASFRRWEECLWRSRGSQRIRGLQWHETLPKPSTREAARHMLLAHLERVLATAPHDAVVLAFSHLKSAGVRSFPYEYLKSRGREVTDCNISNMGAVPRTVYVFLGGAHGFDGDGDRDGGLFFGEILQRASARFGIDQVSCVHLCGNRPSRDVMFTLSQVTSFLAVEHVQGGLTLAATAVALARQNKLSFNPYRFD